VADEGVGSLAYSAKLMPPHPLPSIVAKAMRQVEERMLAYSNDGYYGGSNAAAHEQLEICLQEMGGYFDCALCNHYPNEESACKFHTDPEHGSFWERLTCVVSAGNEDVRKFAFRPIPDINQWGKYEQLLKQQQGGQVQKTMAMVSFQQSYICFQAM